MLKLGRIRRRIDLTPRAPKAVPVKPPAFCYEVGVWADIDAVRYWCGVRGISPIIRPLESGAVSVLFQNRHDAEMFRIEPLWEAEVFGTWKTPRVRRAPPLVQREPI